MVFHLYAISNASSNYLFHRRLSGSFQMGKRNRAFHCAFSDELSGAVSDCKTHCSPEWDRQSFSTASASQRGFLGDLWT